MKSWRGVCGAMNMLRFGRACKISAHIGGNMLHRKLSIALVAACLASVAAAESFPVKIDVDARAGGAALTPIWRFFGADEPNYATMKDGRALLAELGALRPGEVFFRAHNLLTSGDGTAAFKWGSTNAYVEDADGTPRYDWRIIDRIFDTYRANGRSAVRRAGLHAAGPEFRASGHALPARVAAHDSRRFTRRRMGLAAARLPALVRSVLRVDAAFRAALWRR